MTHDCYRPLTSNRKWYVARCAVPSPVMWVTFEDQFRYCKGLRRLCLKIAAYIMNEWSQLQRSDVICEQLFLLSYSTGRTARPRWWWAWPVRIHTVYEELHSLTLPDHARNFSPTKLTCNSYCSLYFSRLIFPYTDSLCYHYHILNHWEWKGTEAWRK